MTKQEQFFYDHAGYAHDPKTQTEEQGHVETARRLATAETWSVQEGHTFTTEHDDDADGSFIEDGLERAAWEARAWYAQLWDGETLLGSIGGCDGGNNYKRVIRAELAIETMPPELLTFTEVKAGGVQ